jgi:hypothetical protein
VSLIREIPAKNLGSIPQRDSAVGRPEARLRDRIGAPNAGPIISVVWAVLAAVIVGLEEGALASAQVEPARSCGVASLRDFDASRGFSLDYLIGPQQQRLTSSLPAA